MNISNPFLDKSLPTSELYEDNSATYYFPVPIYAVFSALSVLGCIFNTVTTIMFKISETAVGKMVIALSITDFIFNASYSFLIFHVESPFICRIGSFFWGFGFAGSLSWCCCFAHCLYRSLKSDNDQTPNLFLKWYFMISGACGFILAVLAALLQLWTLADDANRCVHAARGNEDVDVFILFVTPASLSSIFCCLSYMGIVRKLYQYKKELFIGLLIYPLILIICDFPTAIYLTVASARTGSNAESWLFHVSAILLRSKGFFNALAFGLSKRIVNKYKKLCRRKAPKNEAKESKLGDSFVENSKGEGVETTSIPNFVVI